MKLKLKSLNEQVIVITGASSGIGLTTAKMAYEAGAKVVLCSRNLDELDIIVDEMLSNLPLDEERRAIACQCDVADPDQVERVAEQAIATFGRIDTWVNNAGVTIYGKLREVPLHEKRRLFDVNFWGVVHGCRSAVKALARDGGAIINIGSVQSDRAMPIQGIYSASKHAVKAYTDALRMELEAEGLPISVSLIKPAAIDTPYTEHAKNYMDHKPVHVAPVYSPEIVAKAILECAVTPKRDVFIGGSAKVYSFLETFMPRLADLLMERQMMESGQSDESLDYLRQEPALNRHPSREGRMRGAYHGKVFNRSVATSASLHPVQAAFISTGLGLMAATGIAFLMSRSGRAMTSSMRTGFFAPFGRDLLHILRRDQRTTAMTGYRSPVEYDRTTYFDEPVRH